MSFLITSYRWKDGVTAIDKVINPTLQNIDRRLDDQELRNPIRFYIPGVLAAGNILRFPWPYAAKDISIGLSVNVAPVGAALLFQLTAGGTDVFTAGERPTIADGAQFGTFSVKGTNLAVFAVDDEMVLQVDQIGTGPAGSDLGVIIRSEKT